MVQLFAEDAGVGLSEAIDALLQVAHEEEIIPGRRRQAPIQGVLQGVGVLIFVHHDGGVVLPDGLAQRGGGPVRTAQEPQSLMLEVAEFQQLPLLLFGREAGVEVPHRREQRPQTGQSRQAVRFGFVLAARDEVRDLPEQAGGFVGAGLDGGFVLAGQPLFHPLQPGHRLHAEDVGGQPVVERRPLPRFGQPLDFAQQSGGGFQPFQRLGEFLVDRSHAFRFGGVCPALVFGFDAGEDQIFFAVVQGRAEQLPPRLGIAGGFVQQKVVPAGGVKAALHLPRGQKLVQLAVVVRQGAEKIVDV